MRRRGFTLVEILVAVVVLEVGMLGVVGTLWLAARTLTRAEILERGVEAMESVYDSLSAVTTPSGGTRPVSTGQVRWRTSESLVDLVLVDASGDTVTRLWARLADGAPP